MTDPERLLSDVQDDLAALVAPPAARQARELAAEAYRLGRRSERENGREALGKAWSAFLALMTPEMWRDVEYLEPELWRRLRAAILKEPSS